MRICMYVVLKNIIKICTGIDQTCVYTLCVVLLRVCVCVGVGHATFPLCCRKPSLTCKLCKLKQKLTQVDGLKILRKQLEVRYALDKEYNAEHNYSNRKLNMKEEQYILG